MSAHRPGAAPDARERVLLAWMLAAIGLGLLAVAGVLGFTGWAAGAGLPSVGVVPPAQPVPSATSQGAPEPSGLWSQLVITASPTRLTLPALEVDAPVVPVNVLLSGDLEVPEDPHVLGWWQDGARPGSRTGTVVIVGHVDTMRDGAGALFPLSQALPGQQIALDTDQGRQHYVITALRSYPKTDLPAQLFATTGRARLILITCGGAFDTSTQQYTDNIVAYALPD